MNFWKKFDKRQHDPNLKFNKIHPRVEEAREQGLIMIDEYPFEHAIVMIDSLNVDSLTHGYKKVYRFLNL